jgi:hypothetical protein
MARFFPNKFFLNCVFYGPDMDPEPESESEPKLVKSRNRNRKKIATVRNTVRNNLKERSHALTDYCKTDTGSPMSTRQQITSD